MKYYNLRGLAQTEQ